MGGTKHPNWEQAQFFLFAQSTSACFSPHNLFFLFDYCSYLKKLPPWLACSPLAPSPWGRAQQAEGLQANKKKLCLFPIWVFGATHFRHYECAKFIEISFARNVAENSHFYPTWNTPFKNPKWVFQTGGESRHLEHADHFDVQYPHQNDQHV